MSVGVEALFTSALGLQPPWVVEDVKLDVSKSKRIDFEVSCSGALLTCPACGTASQPVHDRLRRSWRHLDFFQFEAWLHADVPRMACGSAARPPSSACRGRDRARASRPPSRRWRWPCAASCRCARPQRCCAARTSSCGGASSSTSIRRAPSESFAGVQIVGIDETSLRRGQHYITVVHDLDAKRLLFAAEGRDHQTVLDFATDLKAHGGDPAEVRHVCMDMSAAYAKGAAQALPAAAISYDRFHVIAMAIQAMDDVRREELRTEPEEVAARHCWARTPGRGATCCGACARTPAAGAWRRPRDALAAALGAQERAGLAAAHGAARGLRAGPAAQQRRASGQRSDGLDELGRRCRLEPFKKLAATIKERFDAVVRGMLDHRSNAFVESMNGLLQQAKRAARGYRTAKNFIAIAYLRLSRLKNLPAHPFSAAAAVR
jgi:transposase